MNAFLKSFILIFLLGSTNQMAIGKEQGAVTKASSTSTKVSHPERPSVPKISSKTDAKKGSEIAPGDHQKRNKVNETRQQQVTKNSDAHQATRKARVAPANPLPDLEALAQAGSDIAEALAAGNYISAQAQRYQLVARTKTSNQANRRRAKSHTVPLAIQERTEPRQDTLSTNTKTDCRSMVMHRPGFGYGCQGSNDSL